MKNVLVTVTGASPQVLTETLYALHTQGKSFPEEVYVITTFNSKQTLAEIPFVSMRRQINSELLTQPEEAPFSKTVTQVNAANQPLKVQISYETRTLSAQGIDIKLSGKLLAKHLAADVAEWLKLHSDGVKGGSSTYSIDPDIEFSIE